MRIVSLNAWGGALFDELTAWLPAVGADVLCLQEVTRIVAPDGSPTQHRGWTRFADGVRTLPQRADLVSDVRAALPGHRALFDACDRGPVDVDGEHLLEDFGVGMFVDRSCTVVGRAAGFVHGEYTVHERWPTDNRPRVAQAVTVLGPDGRVVTVVHLHGLRDGAGKHDTPARLAQAERLAEFVRTHRERDALVVVCGDLNLLPDSRTFEILRAEGLTDLVGTADARTSHYAKPVRHASYLLVSDPAAVRAFEILAEPEVSDHRALVLDV